VIKVLFHSGRDVFDRAIRIWTAGKASHCEFLFSNGMRFSAYPGEGVCWKPYSVLEKEQSDWRSVTLDVDEVGILNFCISVKGARYDWPGIFLSQVLPLERDAYSRWFCSELVASALQRVGYAKVLGRAPQSFSPASLMATIGSNWNSADRLVF
jgi:hypothetical protein